MPSIDQSHADKIGELLVNFFSRLEELEITELGGPGNKRVEVGKSLVGRGYSYVGTTRENDPTEMIIDYYKSDDLEVTVSNYGDQTIVELGGSGSGNWGHKGRPGQVGGSDDDGVPNKSRSSKDYPQRGETVTYNGKKAKVIQIRTGSSLHGKGLYPPTAIDIETEDGDEITILPDDFFKIKRSASSMSDSRSAGSTTVQKTANKLKSSLGLRLTTGGPFGQKGVASGYFPKSKGAKVQKTLIDDMGFEPFNDDYVQPWVDSFQNGNTIVHISPRGIDEKSRASATDYYINISERKPNKLQHIPYD